MLIERNFLSVAMEHNEACIASSRILRNPSRRQATGRRMHGEDSSAQQVEQRLCRALNHLLRHAT
jgi:hypothetical protein